jgi:aldehyde:ferredoxin oxidoreductase
LKEGASKGSVVNMDLMLDEYYTERGWSLEMGHPSPEELERLGLTFAISDLP